MQEFTRTTNGFNYVFEKTLAPNETVIVKMPVVSTNKRGINDIGWMCSDGVKLYATLSSNPESEGAMWQEIALGAEINKTVSAIKVDNGNANATVVIRAILN